VLFTISSLLFYPCSPLWPGSFKLTAVDNYEDIKENTYESENFFNKTAMWGFENEAEYKTCKQVLYS
jgi:hypothetical protein